MAGRAKPQPTYPKSKAIAAITTLLSAVISEFPNGRTKEILLVLVGTMAYFAYHSFVVTKNLVLREGVRWVSLTITEWKVKKYVRELETEIQCHETTSERLAEIKFQMKRYRDTLLDKRLESLD
ncbi:hypothetical protein SAMN05216327_105379 [Dyadobacter sp. SG02]|uniref:hypothetical protein n=1 Tax=Dyadobacter sp. SG02 TaxID=1855291 RepID=UPI0008BD7C53|nr:hypothetical protein [Dyadobacter sp. SG02]SEJ03284.1 hypothetical protein SAMN05216327_105379 [Dyadobacter sp. SG02]